MSRQSPGCRSAASTSDYRRWSADRAAIAGYQVWTLALFSSIAANPINKPEGVLVG